MLIAGEASPAPFLEVVTYGAGPVPSHGEGVYGMHPYIMHRRNVLLRQKPRQFGILQSCALVLLILSGVAYGLRWIDQRLVPPRAQEKPRPALEMPEFFSDRLSSGMRFLLGVQTAYAADYTTYSGTFVGFTPVIQAVPGEKKTVDLLFKNTGKVTWRNTGRAYVSAYTIKPRYHASLFRSDDWKSSIQTPRLLDASVQPGQTGTIRLALTAPKKIGSYTDNFQIAAEDTSWIWGAWTPIVMNVSGAPSAVPVASVTPLITTPAPAPPGGPVAEIISADESPQAPNATLVDRGAERIEAPGGLPMMMHVIYRNDGTTPWKKIGLHVVAFTSPADGDQSIDDVDWVSPEIPVSVDRYVVRGQSVDLTFNLTTPRKRGDYQLTFDFTADGGELSNAPIVLPIKVFADATAELPAPPSASVPPGVSIGEPMLRVGLYTTTAFEDVSFDGPYEARDASGRKLADFPAGAHAQFSYDLPARLYRVTNGIMNLASALPIRFVPADAGEIFTLWTNVDFVTSNPSMTFNRFRGTLEMRKNDPNDYVWVINELPMEQYLKGMRETSASSPLEYQKAMAVAARSYAEWHYMHPGKHWNFTVDATYDQVYKGYAAETRNPGLSEAVDATRGRVVTYLGDLVVTPYYSSSDGRTRAWTEVWGGSAKPWLVSVACPFDAAAHRPLNGHGVGLSAWDAIGRANAGASYDMILKYYYTGTELKKLY